MDGRSQESGLNASDPGVAVRIETTAGSNERRRTKRVLNSAILGHGK
ncbi:hypothetical protein NJ7G_3812 [Natrinema sp. J7-2]|nr:hypothetical protein NJ7G_3812 [Natrinema sp. J7-2]